MVRVSGLKRVLSKAYIRLLLSVVWNLRACVQEVTSSFHFFKLARSALQMMKYFPKGTNYSDLKGDAAVTDRNCVPVEDFM